MRKIIIFFTVLILCSCSNTEPDITEVNIESTKKETSILEVLDSVHFFLPKTNDNHPIGSIDKVIIKPNGIYILDNLTRKLFLYNHKGNMISVLDNRGKGPKQYLDISDFCIHNDTIYTLLNRKKIQLYDKNLSFISTIRNEVWASKIQKTKKWIWLNAFYDRSNRSPYGLFKLDNSGEIVNKFLKISKDSKQITHNPQFNFVNYKDTIYCIQPLDNIIYSVHNDVLKSEYIMKHSQLFTGQSYPINYSEVFRPEVLSINEHGFILIYYTKNTLELLLKERTTQRYVYPKTLSFSTFKNSGLFSPAFCVGASEEAIITIIPPIITLSYKSNASLMNGLNESYRILVNESDDNSNPIIAIWNIKIN